MVLFVYRVYWLAVSYYEYFLSSLKETKYDKTLIKATKLNIQFNYYSVGIR